MANTLDLIATNCPNSLVSATVVPCISVRDACVITLDIKPVRVIKKPREVPRYGSAKWEDFRQFLSENSSGILSAPADSDVNALSEKF